MGAAAAKPERSPTFIIHVSEVYTEMDVTTGRGGPQ